ncbi:acyl-CoA thioesterase II [Corynebacterium pseudotuberculosis]|uniref:Acyl-CoA thioesterase 2 n=1 Tax=Corynebacterium pseudotuberculosis 258 TaxID=1168865 RepID=A0AAU8PMR2_CORPS|nr:acyl-CoA thioesterase II [Corynebacterium pseudotuberculosis]AER69227.1 Acyl-CoA thioesterase II [Corynebacterium pseudotuberculosis 1/06-A]AEQ06733.1 acyl-CoA thioesterase II [Corynebacterium pseudotuberculosis CIP 52.97]AFB72532.1 acyl-CoA thioesterase II [Corynebacterium pseudotuberculosis 316]AFH91000.2 acyl-CoA thioesterase II [Corynebacterium pseudotuberculosis 31]AFK16826.1 acyl-CoA thioesterase II [Corynebacterium pseudotuberculosis 258]
MSKIYEVLNLENIDRDIFRGPAVASSLTRTFGGQVAAQALVAATRTVPSEAFIVHSLHAYFVRAGDSSQPTIFQVDRVKDGRSFIARHVTAIQDGRPIFSMQSSFHRRDDCGPEHSDLMRRVPEPEQVQVDRKALPASSRELLDEWGDWDIRKVPDADFDHNPYTASQQVIWFKSKEALPDDETFHICTLAYMSDMTLLHASLVPHSHERVKIASLDHAMWFLRPFRADEWLLYDQVSPSAHGGRALTQGRIFNRSGDLVAITTQEGLTRSISDTEEPLPFVTPEVKGESEGGVEKLG